MPHTATRAAASCRSSDRRCCCPSPSRTTSSSPRGWSCPGWRRWGHLHDLIRTVTHGVTTELGYARPGVALEVLVGKRHELALHPAHVDGLTRLLRHAVGTIAARSTPGGGRCFHCDGTGLARPLWELAPGQA
ncbi:hypothetical protein [Streptomyces virginiae]|uniref:hypothetical protein n=1 Tax=Streptomyces virginiae TaxID=1961 RepID=UPI0022527065|nr:hypothetical protein [Streptomyces virginiae]MCX4960035.1 hypothetical protein [Streptomyces virginiae]